MSFSFHILLFYDLPRWMSTVLMGGIYVMSRSARKNIRIQGSAFFASFRTGTPEMDWATYRFTPTGGVTKPMARFTIMMMPKCTGSTPTAWARGSMTGVKIRMLGEVSIIMPSTSKIRFMSSRSSSLWLSSPPNSPDTT